MVDPLGLTQQNENGFQSNNGKDEDTTPELCKWRRILPRNFMFCALELYAVCYMFYSQTADGCCFAKK